MIFKTLTIAGMFAIAGAVLVFNQASVTADQDRLTDSEHLISALADLHPGQWFEFKDGIQTYENIVISDPLPGKPNHQYSIPTKEALRVIIERLVTEKNSFKVRQTVLQGQRELLEARFKAGTHTNDDVVKYLRILGNF